MSTTLVHGQPWSAGVRRPQRLLSLLLTVLLTAAFLPVLAGAAPVDASEDAGDIIPDQLLVTFRPDAPSQAKAQARAAAGAEELATIDQLDVHVWRVPEHAAERALRGLQRNPHVAFAEHDAAVDVEGEVIPDDPWYRFQWGLEQVQAPQAWSTTTGSSAVRIAIVDTGVNEVGDLRGKVAKGHNVLDGSSNTVDNHGHGTRSASVAGVATDNGDGIAAYCWECTIVPVKVMDGSSGTMSDLAKGITWAADAGMDVISMSLSGTSGTSTVQQAVRYAEDRGAVLVAAAGNQGDTTPRYPAAYAEVIAVAATDSSDDRYSWSNYGEWVDVAAPGVNYSVGRDGSIGTYAGTSSATPAAAGVLGLAVSMGGSATEVRDALQAGAEPLSIVKYGRIDAASTIALLASSEEPIEEPVEEEPIEEPVEEEPTEEEPTEEPSEEPASEPEPLTITLSPSSTDPGGPNWTANVTVTVFEDGEPSTDVTVTGAWSDGASGTSSCTTDSNGTCAVSTSGIHNRIKSVTYTVTSLDGTEQAGPSTTVTR